MLETNVVNMIMEGYRRRYRVTLTPTRENILEALRVYDYGVKRGVGIIGALRGVYGYRYRRMENFLRETGLWSDRVGWMTMRTSINIYNRYVGRESIHVDLYFEVDAPVSCIVDAFAVTADTIDLFYEVLESEGYRFVPFEEETVGVELLGWGRPLGTVYIDDYQRTEAALTAVIIGEEKIKGYTYRYDVEAARFHPFYDMGVRPSYRVEAVESRRARGRELMEVMRKWGI